MSERTQENTDRDCECVRVGESSGKERCAVGASSAVGSTAREADAIALPFY